MMFLGLALLGLSWLLMASAGKLCTSMEAQGTGECVHVGASLVQRRSVTNHITVDDVDGSSDMGEGNLGHALNLVTTLVDKSGGHSWNMSKDEQDALKLIRELVATIFNGSLIQYDEDQLEVDSARDRIANCTSDSRNTNTSVVFPAKQTADNSRTDHAQCRVRENKIITNTSQECASYHTYRKDSNNFDDFPAWPTCMSTQLTFNKIKSDDATEKQNMESCLEDTMKTLSPLYQEYSGCKEEDDRRKNVSSDCKKDQEKFEGDFCDYASKLATQCSTYDSCRRDAIGARNRTHTGVKQAEAARKADWTTGTHILCLLRVLEANNSNKSDLLQDCAWANVSTANITITYHAIPAADPCITEPNKPCEAAWLQTEYNDQSWYNSSTIGTCTPCQTPTPVPTPAPTPVPTPAPAPTTPACTYIGVGACFQADNTHPGYRFVKGTIATTSTCAQHCRDNAGGCIGFDVRPPSTCTVYTSDGGGPITKPILGSSTWSCYSCD